VSEKHHLLKFILSNPCEGKNPAAQARKWQTNEASESPYTEQDNWENVPIKAGTVLYTLHPHGPITPNYFVKSKQILRTKGAKEYNDALQLAYKGNEGKFEGKIRNGMRISVHAFTVKQDTCMARAKAFANDALGKGGGEQFFVLPNDIKNLKATNKLIGLGK
jgi:hypothetical protein